RTELTYKKSHCTICTICTLEYESAESAESAKQKFNNNKIRKNMAHYRATTGLEEFTGALSKRKVQGVNKMTVTRRKPIRDPLTGDVVGLGPKEIYI
ncbi:MAG: hypothetical protein IKM83_03100, partial [Paludibacteraceae bacterium]|nr:hypothetical protein [Paludibacteraceae bacterium]